MLNKALARLSRSCALAAISVFALALVTGSAIATDGPPSDAGTFDALALRADALLYQRIATGEAAASLVTANALLQTDGLDGEHDKAETLLKSAAAIGSSAAATLLADIYRRGTSALSPAPSKAIPILEELVAKGDVAAMRTLASMAASGQGMVRSPVRAVELLKQAMALGNLDARFALASMLARGDGVASDGKLAEELFFYGLPGRNPTAISGLADLYRQGATGVAPRPELSRQLYQSLVDDGDRGAIRSLSDMMLRGEGGPLEAEAAIAALTKLAQSDAATLITLGDYFLRGEVVPLDGPKALAFYEEARSAGLPAASIRIADALRAGAAGIERDPVRAYTLYREAGELGDVSAQRRAAELQILGEGTVRDVATGVMTLEALATRGDTASLLSLGDIFVGGIAAGPDVNAALAYYERAATAGSVAALNKMAELYRNGAPSLSPDLKKAVRYFERAVDANDNGARKALASLLWDGAAGDPDPDRAVSLLEEAVGDGDSTAALSLGVLYARGGAAPANYQAAADAFGAAIDRQVPGAKARFGVAILDGPLARTHGNEGARLLREAIAEGAVSATLDLARLQIAGKVPGAAPGRGPDLLVPLADRGDIPAIRALLGYYRDGSADRLQPALSKARALLERSAPRLGAETARQERIFLIAASATTPASLAAILDEFALLSPASKMTMLQRLVSSYQSAHIFILQSWLRDQQRLKGQPNGTLNADTVRALNQVCADAAADLICSKGLMTRDATTILAGFMLRADGNATPAP